MEAVVNPKKYKKKKTKEKLKVLEEKLNEVSITESQTTSEDATQSVDVNIEETPIYSLESEETSALEKSQDALSEPEDVLQSVTVSDIQRATSACLDMLEISKNLIPVEEIEPSNVSQPLSSKQIDEASEACHNILKATENIIPKENIAQHTEEQVKVLTPFSHTQLLELVGSKEISFAETYAVQFESENRHNSIQNHPLYESLMEYHAARSQVLFNSKDVNAMLKTCESKFDTIWLVNTVSKKKDDYCKDGKYFQLKYSYKTAVLQSSLLNEYCKDLKRLADKATEIHSLYSHSEHMHRIQVEEILWSAISQGEKEMKECLRIIFQVMKNPHWGADRQLRHQIRIWCIAMAKALIRKNDTLQNSLFILFNILQLQHSIGWALHLVQCKIESSSDIVNALCLLNVIFSHTFLSQRKESTSLDNADVPIASEATDENLWIVVDSDGEDGLIETNNRQSLGENDLLGFLKQIPFERLFRNLLLIRDYNSEDIFCGENLKGGSVLKIFAICQLLLHSFRMGLMKYTAYQELTKELCRLSLHIILYCSDLWESASANCEPNLLERLITEYNSVFLTTWSTLESGSFKDVCTMFLSEMPFSLVSCEIIRKIYDDISKTLIISDSISCYYSMVCLSNIAISRIEDDLVKDVIHYLFNIGFTSDFSDLSCGEWARTLCGSALSNNFECFVEILINMPKTVKKQWFEVLPVMYWRPQPDEISKVLNSWLEDRVDLIPSFLKMINWNTASGVDRSVHSQVALFLCSFTQKFRLISKNAPLPEWFYEILLLLKLHQFDWAEKINCPSPENLVELDLSGKCHINSMVAILSSTWGHLVPLIYQDGVQLLLKIVNAGRFKEAAHVLYYLLPELATCPHTIADCKMFNEILNAILKVERAYSKKAARFLNGESVGLTMKLLLSLIQTHMENFKKFHLTSPAPLLLVWIYWLTSIDNWQMDWMIVYLLDSALKHCFLHPEAIGEAAKVLEKFVNASSSSKSPTSSSGIGSWLFSGSNTYKGLIQCNIETPFVWHMVLWIEHNTIERSSGLWKRFMEKLVMLNDPKANVDKIFKSVGGGDISNLVIYRSLQNAINVSLDCPIYSLIWQLFFYLYLDLSVISPHLRPSKIISPQLFQGSIRARMILKAKQRLTEALHYQEDKIKNLTEKNNETDKIREYHVQQQKLMKAFLLWLNDDFFSDLTNPRTFTYPFSQKCQMLLNGQNVLWIETVDIQQLKINNGVPIWPECIINDYFKLEVIQKNAVKEREESATVSPSERILKRIKTYEVPLVENEEFSSTQISPLIKPTLLENAQNLEDLLTSNLNHMLTYSILYKEKCQNFTSLILQIGTSTKSLYRKSTFRMSETKSCGVLCTGSVKLIVNETQHEINPTEKLILDVKRNSFKSSVTQALAPYEELAGHTARISKICQLMCNDSKFAKRCGEKMFYLMVKSMKNENLKFPPVNQILDSMAVQLGEAFISINSQHCASLIGKCEKMQCVPLVRSLLKPTKLTTDGMLDVYSVILSSISDPHVGFSLLSKFDIFSWLCESRPTITQRCKILTLQYEALGAAGCNPSNEKIIIIELICMHLSKVLAWEFPVHLNQTLLSLTDLAIAKTLSPSVWQHVFTVIETYPNLITQDQAIEFVETIGVRWWIRRGTSKSIGLYNVYNVYCYSIARLGALLSSCILSNAMLHQPPLMTSEISEIVFNSMVSVWNAWLILWIDHPNQNVLTAILPWSSDDGDSPDIILNALVETITYCTVTLPGSTNDFLKLTWQWYVKRFIHPNTPLHIFTRIHRALEKLPWSKENVHWMSFNELKLLIEVSKFNQTLCHSFAVKCLGNINWLEWYHSHPPEISSSFLGPILPLLFRLKPSQEVLNNALLLPWSQLKFEQFQDIVIWYTVTLNNSNQTPCNDTLLPLICAAGGLVKNSESSGEWQSKRGCLVRGWVNSISLMSQSNDRATKDNAIIGQNIAKILKKIEQTIMTLENVSEGQKSVECSFLISDVITMLNMTVLIEVAQQEWLKWIRTAPKLCIFSVIGCLLHVTQRDTFACLAEEALSLYLKKDGEWMSIIRKWNDSYIVPVEYLLTNGSLLTAFGTYKSLNREKFQGNIFEQLDKNILETLKGFEPSCSCEPEACLWICQMIFLMCDNTLNVGSQKCVIAQNITILEKWCQEPTWGLLKAMKIVQDTAPSAKFRFISRYALCIILTFAKMVHDNSSEFNEAFNRSFLLLENMVSSKACVEFKQNIVDSVDSLRDQNNSLADFLKMICDNCSKLYQESCYCNNLDDIFKL